MAPLCDQDVNASAYYNGEEEPTDATNKSSCSSSLSSTDDDDSSSESFTTVPTGKRSVSFSAGAAVHLGAVMHVDDYSETEKYQCWYQADELREIRKEVKETVALMNQNVPIDEGSREDDVMNYDGIETTVTTHGLEGKTRTGKRNRREVRIASLSAVFDEQTMQEMDGVDDPVMIAMAYIEYSYPMQVAAFQRASQYQKQAASIYQFSNSCKEHDLQQPTPDTNIMNSFEINRSEEPVGPVKYDFNVTRSEPTYFQLGNSSDHSQVLASKDAVVADDRGAGGSLQLYEPDDDINRPFNMGPLTIRDRFACFLPGSSSNGRRSLMGALRVVQI